MVQNGKQASSRPGSPRKDNACNSDPIPASLCGMGCPHLNFVLTHNSIVDGLIGALAMAFFLRKREKSVWIQLLDTINWPMLEFSPSSRGFVCAGCVHFYNRKHNGFESHFQQTGHCIAVDLKRAETYCHSCGNYVFSTILDQIRYKIKSRIQEQSQIIDWIRFFVDLQASQSIAEKPNSPRFKYPALHDDIRKHFLLHVRPDVWIRGFVGLRGLYSLGHTCFMNAVLQAMTHIPILRDFFLSQRHRREHCSFVHGRPEDAGSVCMSCQMDRIFEEMYCGKNTPFPPHHFLNAMWKHADHLAGYQQHDAHELFVSLLDGIHSSSGGSVKDCLCIIHSSFGGQLQSVVKCLTCDSRSSTIEMFLDLSLQIKHYSVASNGLAIPSMNRSLKECLLMYFHEEILSGNNKFFCQTCKEPRVSSKRFWIDHIPPVLCFHLKRFEHHYLNPKLGSKIDTLVSFPLEFLDMSEFMHSGRSPLYRLLGLIVHTGNLHHGHYFVYLRIENCWFCCDDTWIYPVFEHQVPLSQAYMLFYARDDLEHLPLAHT